jgi:hypothetical protein
MVRVLVHQYFAVRDGCGTLTLENPELLRALSPTAPGCAANDRWALEVALSPVECNRGTRHSHKYQKARFGGPSERYGVTIARKFDTEKLKTAAADWDFHHPLVAAVRRLVKLSGGPQEAKDVIDAIVAADTLEEEKDEAR